MAYDPNEFSAGNQQSGSGDPARPLTRRELRALEAQQSEDRMANELERQMLGLRPDSALFPEAPVFESAAPVEEIPAEVVETASAVTEGVAPQEPTLLRRDRSNRPPLAAAAEQVSEGIPSPEEVEPVAVAASEEAPVTGPVLTEPPTTTASIPAPISLIPQSAAVEQGAPSPKVKIKLKRKSAQPKAVAPMSPKRRGAQVFSLAAMAFVAGLAIATSIPANALLSPEDIALQSEQARLSTLPIGDGQSVEGTGAEVLAGRDGVSVTRAQAAPTAGAYAPKKLNVNVPVSNNGIQWPVKEVKISSPFGDRNLFGWYNFHTGLDFDPAYGTPIYAVADGVVSLVENPGPTCGVAIFIEHNVSGTKFTSVYCHMVVDSPPFKAGDTVSRGDLVGNIGLTGITTGPHLHLEIRVNDVPIDPYAFLVQHAGKSPNEVRS